MHKDRAASFIVVVGVFHCATIHLTSITFFPLTTEPERSHLNVNFHFELRRLKEMVWMN